MYVCERKAEGSRWKWEGQQHTTKRIKLGVVGVFGVVCFGRDGSSVCELQIHPKLY